MVNINTYSPEQTLTINDSGQIIIERKKYGEILIAVSDWICTISRIEDDIIELQNSTKDQWLHIGSKLNDYHSCSSQIVNISLDTAKLLSGNSIHEAIANLKNILDDFKAFVKISESEQKQYIESVKEILYLIDKAREPLSVFKKIVKHLRIWGISTKIENSRLESQLVHIITNCQSYIEHCGISLDQIDMKEIEKQYTMNSERKIHNDFVHRDKIEDVKNVYLDEVISESDDKKIYWGKNVEFF